MSSIFSVAHVASLIGDPARANMLYALKDSGTVSAGDLTRAANVAPSTASEHLAKMVDAGLVKAVKSGRHRYFTLTSERISELLDGLDAVGDVIHPSGPPGMRDDEAALHSRSCADHLAGQMGVALADAFFAKGFLAQKEGKLSLTDGGRDALTGLGLNLSALDAAPRRIVTLCHDWSGGSVHLGGALGGGLLKAFCERDWMRRPRGSFTVRITPTGRAALRRSFGIELGLAS